MSSNPSGPLYSDNRARGPSLERRANEILADFVARPIEIHVQQFRDPMSRERITIFQRESRAGRALGSPQRASQTIDEAGLAGAELAVQTERCTGLQQIG